MNIIIASLRFSPAFISHMKAYEKMLKIKGHNVAFFIDAKYMEYEEFKGDNKCFSSLVVEELKKYDMVLVVNAAVENIKFALLCRVCKTRIIYIFHEPDVGIKRIKKEGIKNAIKLVVAALCSYIVCKCSYKVVVASKFAYKKYMSNFCNVNNNVEILPLMYCDEVGEHIGRKKYFSYIGTIAKVHAFDKYVLLIKEIYKIEPQMRFLIATKSDMSDILENDLELKKMQEDNVLNIYHKKIMTNEEINRYYMESFCVWNAYSLGTQSGVLGKAFMAGASVIATNVGSFEEFITSGKNGEFVDNEDTRDMIDKVMKIYMNMVLYSKNARNAYKEIFDCENNVDRIDRIIS